jgi:hypothetical protein
MPYSLKKTERLNKKAQKKITKGKVKKGKKILNRVIKKM